MARVLCDMSAKMAREVLGVTAEATPDEVRAAYRDAARRAHPDAGGHADVFLQVVEAYARLRDTLAEASVEPTPRPPSDPQLEIGPDVALNGGDVDHRTPEGAQVRITLPAGLRSGDRVQAAGLRFAIYIRAEDGLLVRGDDIWMTVRVAPTLLRNGGRLAVETPLGPRRVWVDAKSAARGLLRIEGQGLPPRGDRPRGHLFLRLAPAPGLADTAARTLLRRFTAAWAD